MGDSVQTLHASGTPTAAHSDIAWQLAPALDAAVEAGRAAHRAAAALTDTLATCQNLPADIYRYAPDVCQTAAALTAAGRALTGAVHAATTTRMPEHLHAVHQAVNTLLHATTAVDVTVGALRTAADWYTVALPTDQPADPTQRGTA